MNIVIVKDSISLDEVNILAKEFYHDMVKGVADIECGIIALGGEWHMDANKVLIEDGSAQDHVWGFNIYPDKRGDAAIEYISLINIRPGQGNRSMEIADAAIRDTVRGIIERLIPEIFV